MRVYYKNVGTVLDEMDALLKQREELQKQLEAKLEEAASEADESGSESEDDEEEDEEQSEEEREEERQEKEVKKQEEIPRKVRDKTPPKGIFCWNWKLNVFLEGSHTDWKTWYLEHTWKVG